MPALVTGGGVNYGDILSTPYGLKGELPPELATQQQTLNRRQQIANLMLQQATQMPQGRMAGKFYVPPSWAQNLAQLGEGIGGLVASRSNEQAQQGIHDQSRTMLADAVQQYQAGTAPSITEGPRPTADIMPPPPSGAGLAPQPARQAVATELAGPGAPVSTPATPEARRQALIDLMASQHPQAQALGKLLSQQQFADEQRDEDRALRRDTNASNLELRKGQIEANMLNTQAMIGSRERMGQEANDLKKVLSDQSAELKKLEIEGRKDVAKIAADSRMGVAGVKAGQRGQLPTAALKMQQEQLDAIGLASSLNADLKALDAQVTSGKLKLGMVDNLMGTAKNFMGMSDEQSRNLGSFKATLEKQRNDSLRLNKGVQTEGDAIRAWDELIANINDPKFVSQRLKEISAINERGANLRKLEVDVIRKNYGLDPLETEGFTDQPAALGKGPAVGTVEGGYRFKGGNPAKAESWEKVQ